MRNSWHPPSDANLSQQTGHTGNWANWNANQRFVQNRNAQLFQPQVPANLTQQGAYIVPYSTTSSVSSEHFPQQPSPNRQMPQAPTIGPGCAQPQSSSPRGPYPVNPYDYVMQLLGGTLAALKNLNYLREHQEFPELGLMMPSPLQQQGGSVSNSSASNFNPSTQLFPPNSIPEDSQFLYIGGEAIPKATITTESLGILLLRKSKENEQSVAKHLSGIENAVVSLSRTLSAKRELQYHWERLAAEVQRRKNLAMGRNQTFPTPPGLPVRTDNTPAMSPRFQSERADDNNNEGVNELASVSNSNQTCFGTAPHSVQGDYQKPNSRFRIDESGRVIERDTEDLRRAAIENARKLVTELSVGSSSPQNHHSSSNSSSASDNPVDKDDNFTVHASVPSHNEVVAVQPLDTGVSDQYDNVFEDAQPPVKQVSKRMRFDFEPTNLMSSNCQFLSPISQSVNMPPVSDKAVVDQYAMPTTTHQVSIESLNSPPKDSPSSSSQYVLQPVETIDPSKNALKNRNEASTNEFPVETASEKAARYKKIIMKQQTEFYLNKRKSITMKDIDNGIAKKYPCMEALVNIIKWNNETNTRIPPTKMTNFFHERLKFYSTQVVGDEDKERSRVGTVLLYSCIFDLHGSRDYRKCIEEDVWYHISKGLYADHHFHLTTQFVTEYCWTNIRAYVSRQAILRKFTSDTMESRLSDIEKEFMTAARTYIEQTEPVGYTENPIFKERRAHYERGFGESSKANFMTMYYTVLCHRIKVDEINENVHVLNYDFQYLSDLHDVLSDKQFDIKETKYLELFFN